MPLTGVQAGQRKAPSHSQGAEGQLVTRGGRWRWGSPFCSHQMNVRRALRQESLVRLCSGGNVDKEPSWGDQSSGTTRRVCMGGPGEPLVDRPNRRQRERQEAQRHILGPQLVSRCNHVTGLLRHLRTLEASPVECQQAVGGQRGQ